MEIPKNIYTPHYKTMNKENVKLCGLTWISRKRENG